ncbi:MAG: beta-ketoacyl-[acyl-carrier-protein] synthase family protein [Candidatus Omnitrophota bacterium]
METVITGIGVIAANGIGKDKFWQSLEEGRNAVADIRSFETERFTVKQAAEIKDFDPKQLLGIKGLRNLDRGTLFLLGAAKLCLEDAQLEINEANTDQIGVCTGTTFPHLSSIVEFDKEVFKEGIDFANPALFPSTVINAASSQVSIRHNIQGFNTTLSTGYTSSLESLIYSMNALDTDKVEIVLCASVESLIFSLFFGFQKLGYMAGLKGAVLSCPFDKRRNGPLLGEAAVMFCLEESLRAKQRKAKIYAKVRGASSYFDAFQMGKVHPQGEGLEEAVKKALDEAGVEPGEIDYISSCANSSPSVDKIEVKVLKKVFGSQLKNIPVSSIKSMLGETFSASGALQITSCIGAFVKGVVPPTINFQEKDPDCDIDCVPNKSIKKDVNLALVTSFGPGGYNSACVLEKYN